MARIVADQPDRYSAQNLARAGIGRSSRPRRKTLDGPNQQEDRQCEGHAPGQHQQRVRALQIGELDEDRLGREHGRTRRDEKIADDGALAVHHAALHGGGRCVSRARCNSVMPARLVLRPSSARLGRLDGDCQWPCRFTIALRSISPACCGPARFRPGNCWTCASTSMPATMTLSMPWW